MTKKELETLAFSVNIIDLRYSGKTKTMHIHAGFSERMKLAHLLKQYIVPFNLSYHGNN